MKKINNIAAWNARQSGFNLIELMVAIVVLGVILAVGIPSFGNLIENNRITATTNDVVTALNMARSEAVKRGTSVEFNKTGNDWSDGWQVRLKGSTDDAGLLRVWQGPKKQVDISLKSGDLPLIFDGRGAAESGAVCLEISLGDKLRAISVQNAGRIGVAQKACD
ncbi:MAG TPA: prepilin-type N-terminal cleavage/methylation domain-containing protein [Halothiobacillaceae bacterium]|nr:prepilin-type N-terminal cleavage/methylation domain-containing protein [Halothiobacillaceae bacterium]